MTGRDLNLILVNRQGDLEALADRLLQVPAFGVDTEANSLYRYHARVCLVQISIPGEDYIVDPLATDPRPLGAAFAADNVQKVMHAGEYDVMCLRRDYGFEFHRLFDTMLAARMIGMAEFGLAALLRQYFGVDSDKRFQRADWGQRPLTETLLTYAALDSHYLLQLRDLLQQELARNGAVEEAFSAFSDLCQVRWHAKPFDRHGYRRLPGARDLDCVQLTVLRELYLWREATAKEVDRPPFRVARPDLLVRLSRLQPSTKAALALLIGNRNRWLSERAAEVLECICRGREGQGEPPLPNTNRGGRRRSRRGRTYQRLNRWRKDMAQQLGLRVEQILSSESLDLIVKHRPRTLEELASVAGVDPTQADEHGDTILELLKPAGGDG